MKSSENGKHFLLLISSRQRPAINQRIGLENRERSLDYFAHSFCQRKKIKKSRKKPNPKLGHDFQFKFKFFLSSSAKVVSRTWRSRRNEIRMSTGTLNKAVDRLIGLIIIQH